MEYRGKHHTIIQGAEPDAWNLLDHRIAMILQISAVLTVQMIELRRLRVSDRPNKRKTTKASAINFARLGRSRQSAPEAAFPRCHPLTAPA
jgi:hypothetical protein